MRGIYGIKCLNTNKWYIGQSNNIMRRWMYHVAMLNAGRHHSHKLQDAWDRYGAESFTFRVIRQSEIESLDILEEECIRMFHGYSDGYNAKYCPEDSPLWNYENNHPSDNYMEEQDEIMDIYCDLCGRSEALHEPCELDRQRISDKEFERRVNTNG